MRLVVSSFCLVKKLGGLFVVAEAGRGVLQQTLDLCAKNNAILKHLNLSVARNTEEDKTFLILLDITDCNVLLEGFIAAGYLTTVLGIKMKVEETRYAVKGDLNCTFEAKPEN